MNIAIKWHTFRDLVKEGKVNLVTGGTRTALAQDMTFDTIDLHVGSRRAAMEGMFNALDSLPYLVVSDKLVAALQADKEAHARELQSMVDADVFHFPFPKILLQTPDGHGGANFLVIEELSEPRLLKGERLNFRCQRFAITGGTGRHKAAVVWPTVTYFRLNPKDAEEPNGQFITVLTPNIFAADTKDIYRILNELLPNAQDTVIWASVYGSMVWLTRGLAKTVVEPPPKLNKARLKNRKTPVRGYTLLSLGSVFDRNGVEHKVGDGGTMPFHRRRGHERYQRHGPGCTLTKRLWIEACFVNYDPHATVPVPKYLLAKPMQSTA